MTTSLTDVGDRDGWRCWLCDAPVDPEASVNSDLGPSVDSGPVARAKKGKRTAGVERLAHRQCNTRKGAVAPVVPWPQDLLVADAAPLVAVVERLERKGGREVVGRCAGRGDAEQAALWLQDRLSRFAPDLGAAASVDSGGGQFLLVLTAGR